MSKELKIIGNLLDVKKGFDYRSTKHLVFREGFEECSAKNYVSFLE